LDFGGIFMEKGVMPSLLRSLRAASDPTRARLLLLLDSEELTVAELQEILGMGQSRISASLALLKREGLLADRRVGRHVFYHARGLLPEGLVPLLQEAVREIAGAQDDRAALALALRRRKDRASAYFDRLAGKFGRTYIPGRSWQALAHGLLSLRPAETIADLGAGEGTLSQLLAATAEKVIAIDNSEKMVAFGSSTARENGFTNLEYRLGDIEDPPIADGEVDLALFSQALHHAASPPRALASAFRIVRPGGRVLILDLASHGYEQARDLYAHLWLGFSEIELDRLVRGAGFEPVRVTIVARERRAPNFQTILACGVRPEQ
jgi:ubiquinone/menaquinone biosynthesis C-methylase UbiE/DNA-binding transcriptional ArsR family regulator